jgi:hypothetical protein
MQFIINGPDIPDALLQAHEEGRVVFFCGAGVSYPAGLPDFKGLVEKIYKNCGTDFSRLEKEAFDRGQYDTTLDLLERRVPGQRLTVRRALQKSLKPNVRKKGAIDTQAALLQLSKCRDGAYRMVTTNFDRTFDVAARRKKLKVTSYAAPMLPIPKKSRWDGLVYLHGQLPQKSNDSALNRLVFTSGDFGLAYLTERWAARFISELFRNFVVCFVGYSINDPVLRYMMDALAADRMQGEFTRQAFAFGDYEYGEEDAKKLEWEAKGVQPILYEVESGTHDHSSLHNTLHVWADVYRDGIQGKEAIVNQHAVAQPQVSTRQDNFVGRMLWALIDESGLPAKRFADFNPAPSIDWLFESFSQRSFNQTDLVRLGVPPKDKQDKTMQFSLVSRPAPYDKAPFMQLVTGGASESQWDKVMLQLARWLTRHINDPRLILWVANNGAQPQEQWSWLIENHLDRIWQLKKDGNTAELSDISSHAPMAVPDASMTTLWEMLLSGHVKSNRRNFDIYNWDRRFKRDGLKSFLKIELRNILSPKIQLKKPFRWNKNNDTSESRSNGIRQLVDWELVLAADNVGHFLKDKKGGKLKESLPLLLDDIEQLLLDALNLMQELGEASSQSDRSYWYLPSISPHWQNRGYRDWVCLIELLRDAWLQLYENEDGHSKQIPPVWFECPYPTFKRLALFSASKDGCVSPEQWTNWLLSNSAWWLWSVETAREVYRLFVLQGKHLKGVPQELLETAILAGPPREIYRDGLEPERWDNLVAKSIWLHLAKLKSSGLKLGDDARTKFLEISQDHPKWKLAENERDEFSHWMSGTGDPDYEGSYEVDIAPRKRKELVQWLTSSKSKEQSFDDLDTWQEVCKTRLFHSLAALHDLAHKDKWPMERWSEAFYAWSEKGLARRSWNNAAKLLTNIPDDVLEGVLSGICYWLENVAKEIEMHEDVFLSLCDRIINLNVKADTGIMKDGVPLENPVTNAINHPIGNTTSALIHFWLKQNPSDNELLPAGIKELFTRICKREQKNFRHGRVILASRVIALFRVDRDWSEQKLLPLFNWDDFNEAKSAWEGFLWSPRIYQPLLLMLKHHVLETSKNYAALGEHRQQFATFLTYLALNDLDGYSVEDFRSAISNLPQEGLDECAQALSQAVDSSGEQCEDYWENRAKPFWLEVWPKSLDLISPSISDSLARLAISTRDKFPVALASMKDWLQPIEHPDYVIHLLNNSKLCERYPADALLLLDLLIDNQRWKPSELMTCLQQIASSDSQLSKESNYKRLLTYIRTS